MLSPLEFWRGQLEEQEVIDTTPVWGQITAASVLTGS